MSGELAPASILGIGAVTPIGRDLRLIADCLRQPVTTVAAVLRVRDEVLADPGLNRHMRRADRFIRMATTAATDACNAAKSACENVPLERIGMILSSGFGPHCRGFRFLDGLLDNGDDAASPTDFSHSVHGAALAYISGLQGFRGPSLTVTDFEKGFEEAVQLAQCWLADRTCDRVLIGAVEELGEVMLSCISRTVDDPASYSPGEGAVFLMLGPADCAGSATITVSDALPHVDLLAVEDPLLPLQSKVNISEPAMTTFLPYFGQTASCSAFALLGSLLALQEQQSMGRVISPRMQTSSLPSKFNTAAIVRLTSDDQPLALLLNRTVS